MAALGNWLKFLYVCRMNTTRSLKTVFWALALSLLLPLSAGAEDEFSIGIGTSVSVSPYRNYDVQWMPLPILSYEGEYAYLRGLSAGVKVVNLEFLELSAFAAYDATEFDHHATDNNQLNKLDDRYSSLAVGVGARLLTPVGMFHAKIAGDVISNSNGFTGDAGWIYSWEQGALEVMPALGLYWNSDKYNDYYYGVCGKEAEKSGLGRYSASSGFSPYVGLTVDVEFYENWDVFCSAEITFLDREIRKSPMVNKSHTESLTTGISYSF